MRVLITGAKGFIGSNLSITLETMGIKVHKFESHHNTKDLQNMICDSDFVVHLAGVNRPERSNEFYEGNVGLTEIVVDLLEKYNPVPILISSSIQVEKDNDYGKSKKMAEEVVSKYDKSYILRLHNVYGKWSKPNYNSVVATWCHNIARGLEVEISDRNHKVPFVYIDDVVDKIVRIIQGEFPYGLHMIDEVDLVSLGEVYDLLVSFKRSREDLFYPNLSTRFSKNLYSTYLSYIPIDEMKYSLLMHEDHRGSFTEVLKSNDVGQISINVSKPGITKGEHWHHSKNEKFLVVYGKGIIEMRHMLNNQKIQYSVSGDKLEVIDIPTGYTHNIINVGETDMVTLMWANEVFDKENPDTYYEEV